MQTLTALGYFVSAVCLIFYGLKALNMSINRKDDLIAVVVALPFLMVGGLFLFISKGIMGA